MQVTAGMQTGEKEYGKDHGNGKLYSPVDLAIDTVTGNILGPFFPFALLIPSPWRPMVAKRTVISAPA